MTTYVYRSASMRDDNAEHVCKMLRGKGYFANVVATEKRSHVVVSLPRNQRTLEYDLARYAHFELKEVV